MILELMFIQKKCLFWMCIHELHPCLKQIPGSRTVYTTHNQYYDQTPPASTISYR